MSASLSSVEEDVQYLRNWHLGKHHVSRSKLNMRSRVLMSSVFVRNTKANAEYMNEWHEENSKNKYIEEGRILGEYDAWK
jgi:hypothetical protein